MKKAIKRYRERTYFGATIREPLQVFLFVFDHVAFDLVFAGDVTVISVGESVFVIVVGVYGFQVVVAVVGAYIFEREREEILSN